MLRVGNANFTSAYETFRSTVDLTNAGIEPKVFEGLRDPSQGRELSW